MNDAHAYEMQVQKMGAKHLVCYTCLQFASMHKLAQIPVGVCMGFHRLLLRMNGPRPYLLSTDPTHSQV
jgi:hypothetical protein